MNNKEKILRYLSDTLGVDEKQAFERELSQSAPLTEELERQKVMLGQLNFVPAEGTDDYFRDLIPLARRRIENRKRHFEILYQLKISMAFTFMLIIGYSIFNIIYNNNPQVNLEKELASMSENTRVQLLDSIIDEEPALIETDETHQKLSSFYEESLAAAVSSNIELDNHLDEISEQDAEAIFNSLKDKNVLEK